MNEIKIFENPEFGSVRTVQIDGEPWFVGRDVAEALGYKNTADAIGKHVDSDDKLTSQIAIAGQRRDNNTDLKAAFEKVLAIAEKNNIPQEEMPKAIVVISDMEIDHCGNREWSFYDKMANKFRKSGYVIPNLIFWNVNSRHIPCRPQP